MSRYSDTLLDLAIQAYDAGDAVGAEALLRLLLGSCGQRDAQALYLLGHLALRRGELDVALGFLTHAVSMRPDDAVTRNDIGATLSALGRMQEAGQHLDRAVALDPALGIAHRNLAVALVALNRPQEALGAAREALKGATDPAAAHCDLGDVLGCLDRHAEAISQYELALALRPGDPRARYARGLIRLALGDLPAAWTDFEARLELPATVFPQPDLAKPMWRGNRRLGRRTVLLNAETGVDDTIQFVRYVPFVARLGATVVLLVPPGLGRLCQTIGGAAQVLETGAPLPRFDLHCPLPSLPARFGTDLASLPAEVPYLAADPAVRTEWSQALGPWQKMRVGVAWTANSGHTSDRGRSMPFQLLEPLLRRQDIACHIIQRNVPEADRAAFTAYPGLSDHSLGLGDFEQLAALISLMDLVIAVDTAAVHLAGALGIPAWVMLPHVADWRWMRDREDSPWYPSLRLFRQARPGDWRPVLQQIGRHLDQWSVKRS